MSTHTFLRGGILGVHACPMMPFRQFLEFVKPAVNQRIEEVARGEGDIDPAVLPLLTRGKRMRAGLLLRIYACLVPGWRTSLRQVLDLACAVEFAHAASLILDDMLDGDATRRGLPSLHLTRGEGRAVLETIGILALPYALAAPYGAGYVAMLASAQRRMARGVAWEMLGGPDLPASERYDAIVTRKTGCLFSLAAAWGGMAAGADGEVVRALARYGLSTGKVMQIADDITDLDALANGVRQSRPGSESLLLQSVMERSHPPGANGTREALERVLEREIRDAAAGITGDGWGRVPLEAKVAFRATIYDIVGLTLGKEGPIGGDTPRALFPQR